MKLDPLRQFAQLKKSLENERAHLQARLEELTAALGSVPIAATGPMPAAFNGPAREGTRGGKRRMSAEARARIAESQRARWAKIHGKKSVRARRSPVRPTTGRAENTVTLREALLTLAKAKPRTRQELIDGLGSVGYTTKSKDPGNLMNRHLYGKTAILKSAGGKFSPK